MKMLSLTAAASMLGLALAMPPMTDLQAAELKILAGGSMTGSLNELGPQFERASGQMRAPKELKQRSAQHQREVGRTLHCG